MSFIFFYSLQHLIPFTFVYIRRHNRSDDLKKHEEFFAKSEFKFIRSITEKDEEHLKKLYEGDKSKNRYVDILPYEYNRVIIENGTEEKYINASWIHAPFEKSSIATQGPTDETIEDFWELIYSNNVNVIVMLCQLEEDGQKKCAKYWGNPLEMSKYKVEFNEEKPLFKERDVITKRVFSLSKKGEENSKRKVIQYQYNDWPDKKKAEGEYGYLENLIRLVDKRKGNSPFVVHCSAGVGRTGTFLSMYCLEHEILKQIYYSEKEEPLKFSVLNIVRKLKEFRLVSVQNSEQYSSIYLFLNNLLKIYNN